MHAQNASSSNYLKYRANEQFWCQSSKPEHEDRLCGPKSHQKGQAVKVTTYPYLGKDEIRLGTDHEGWVGHRASLDGSGKSRPPPGFDPRTVQPVAWRNTD